MKELHIIEEEDRDYLSAKLIDITLANELFLNYTNTEIKYNNTYHNYYLSDNNADDKVHNAI